MPFAQFRASFPDIAEKETRSFTVFDNNDWGLPPDTYVLFELYCNENKCDCRRVFFDVFSTTHKKFVAIVAYGWESAKFYAKWLRDDSPKMIREIQGPSLNIGSRQSKIAEDILKLVREALEDSLYLERIIKHYRNRSGSFGPVMFARLGNAPSGKTPTISIYLIKYIFSAVLQALALLSKIQGKARVRPIILSAAQDGAACGIEQGTILSATDR